MATPLLRLRSDQQLVGLFRAGNEDAFRVIHDRYRARLLAYVRQMLAGLHPEAEDVLQDVFVRAYAGLRANGRELSLRAWLYRIAHNRCVDELRRPEPPLLETSELTPSLAGDPAAESEQRESLRRLVADIGRLPEQQRSALLMRELSGMGYVEIAGALRLSVPAVKSLLVRARVGLAAALEARDTACQEIRRELAAAHDRGVRPSGLARRHLHDCSGCRDYRSELRGVSRQLAALAPAIGPLGALARLLGVGSGGGATAAGGTGSGVAAFGGGASAGGTFLGAATSHVAAVVAAALVTAGGAVEIQRTVAAQLARGTARHHKRAVRRHPTPAAGSAAATVAPTVVASLSSTAPTLAQQQPAPTAHVQLRHSRRIVVHAPFSTYASACSSGQASAPSQPCAPATDASGTQTAGSSSGTGSASVCESTTEPQGAATPPQGATVPPQGATTTPQGAATAPQGTTASVATAVCGSSAASISGSASGSTGPAGFDPSGAGGAPSGTPVGSTPGSGSQSGTGSAPPAQQT